MDRLLFRSICMTVLLSFASPAFAVITTPLPLKLPIERETWIFVAKVKEILPDKPAMVLAVEESLKGKPDFERMPINLVGNEEAKKDKHSAILLDRIQAGQSIVLFASLNRKKDKYVTTAFSEGTWFSLEGRIEKDGDKTVVRWGLENAEPYLRRTFKGTTAELRQAIVDSLAGRKEPPEWNEKETPGYGPLLAKKKTHLPRSGGVLVGVIQLPFLGLIAALAALFPAVFGGLALLMKRWVALLSSASALGILYAVILFMPRSLAGTYLGTERGLWMISAGIVFVIALWAGHRYRAAKCSGRTEEMQSRRIDRRILGAGVALTVGLLGYAIAIGDPLLASPWLEALVTLATLGAGLIHVLLSWKRQENVTALSTETVMLWTLFVACVASSLWYAGQQPRGEAVTQSQTSEGETISEGVPVVKMKPIWEFTPEENGIIFSSPCVTPTLTYVGIQHQGSFKQYGRVYAVETATGKKVWEFDEDEKLKAVFCSPVCDGGRVYIGEGFHQDANSRIFCLDAKTGTKLWSFTTQSHCESTPAVADGIVAFGAGNDGIYGLDAVTGKEVWHYAGTGGLHVDSNPAIHRGQVFAGSGLSRTHQINRVFALDLKTGKEVWSERVEDSAYGSPVAVGGEVFFGTGNGNYGSDREPIRGHILGRNAADGRAIWDRLLPNSIVGKPAVGPKMVWAGCRDGQVYALDRKTGEIVWKSAMGSPVVASPTVDMSPVYRTPEVIYVASQRGRLAALSPSTGKAFWNLDTQVMTQSREVEMTSTPAVLREELPGRVRRRIVIGAGLNPPAAIPKLWCFEDETVYGD